MNTDKPLLNIKFYNGALLVEAYRSALAYGRKTLLWDDGRCDRARSIIERGELLEKRMEYAATMENCQCPDSQYRRTICKHSIAIMIDKKYDKLAEEAVQAEGVIR